MRIGRKDKQPKKQESAPTGADSADTAAAEDAQRKELEQKYAAGKSFDWSKVGSLGKRVKEEKKREEAEQAKKEAEAPVVAGRKPLAREHAIAAGVAIALSLFAIVYFLMPSGELRSNLSVDQANQQKAAEQRQDRVLLNKLEKEFGPDHPQVKQMKMELGDVPFPGR